MFLCCAAFEKFGAIDAVVIIDKLTNKSRGFGFVKFSDAAGRDEAIIQMNQADLDGRSISVTKAIPQDQTAPGTPAAALGGGRRGEGPERSYSRPYERSYDRGYDRYRGAAPSYDRYAAYPPRAPAYDARYSGYGYARFGQQHFVMVFTAPRTCRGPAYDRPYDPYAARCDLLFDSWPLARILTGSLQGPVHPLVRV
jgi:RNA recognition motif-containing protein